MITTIFNSLLEREGEDPIIKGNKSKGSLIRSTFNPINISSEKGSQSSSTKKSAERTIGKYFFCFIITHLWSKSVSKKKFIVRPIKETLIGNFPKLMLAAKEDKKNKYIFL